MKKGATSKITATVDVFCGHKITIIINGPIDEN